MDSEKSASVTRLFLSGSMGLFDAIDTLGEMPKRYMVDEAETEIRGTEVRRMIYRKYVIR